MKRVIKFRAWDNKDKKWLLGYEYKNLGGFAMFGEVMMFGQWSGLISANLSSGFKFIKLMQFTGLTDNNGKEIYEGDILQRYKKSGEPYKKTKTVEWFHAGFKGIEQITESAVIGNIYENPELLEKK